MYLVLTVWSFEWPHQGATDGLFLAIRHSKELRMNMATSNLTVGHMTIRVIIITVRLASWCTAKGVAWNKDMIH